MMLGVALGWFKYGKKDYYYEAFIFERFKVGKNNILIHSYHQCTIELGPSSLR